MRDFWIIVQQTFMSKVKTKPFIITSIVMILAVFVMANLSKIVDTFSNMGGDRANELVVVMEDDTLYQTLVEQVKDKDIEIKRSEKSNEALIKEVKDEKIEAFATITVDENDMIAVTYQTNKMMDDNAVVLEEALNVIQTAKQTEKLSLTPAEVQTLFTPIAFDEKNISTSVKSDEELGQASVLVYILTFLIYMTVIMYSGMIMTDVANEKSSRVMEILISSVSPVKHMFAKVFGMGLLGMMQMSVLGIAAYIAFTTNKSVGTIGELFKFDNVSPMTLVYCVIFFILGYFLYAMLAALLGSIISRTEDASQMMMPMTILIVIAFIITMSGLGNPELAYIKWASYFPFFTPLVMFLRVGLLDLPVWEPLLAIAIMVVTIGLLGWIGARVYRGGVLMYGPSRSLKDIKKAIQLGKE